MKTICIQLSLLALTIGGLGCKKIAPEQAGIPVVPLLSYDLLDGAGMTSWFTLPGSAPPDSVLFQATYANGFTQRYHPILFAAHERTYLKDTGYGFSNSNVVVAPDGTSYTSTLLIYLNRHDVDTLRTEVYNEKAPNSALVNHLLFYYNDRLSASYDLHANPALRDSLYQGGNGLGLVVPLHKYHR